jgi:hypothetical protein
MSKPETDPRTTAPKTDDKAPTNPFAPFFQMPFNAEGFAPWMREHAGRITAISEEISSFEKAMTERAKTGAADFAQLVKDSLDYMTQVGAEWRKIAIDTARRAADIAAKA